MRRNSNLFKIIIIVLTVCFSIALMGSCVQTETEEEFDEMELVNTEPNFDIVNDATEDTNFTLPSLLTEKPVYQRDRVLRIWGNSLQDGPVAVQIGGNNYYGDAKDGKFEIYIAPLAAGSYEMVVRNSLSKKTVKNILAGDVFICSGQSNMAMLMAHCDYSSDVENSANPSLRLLVMPSEYSLEEIEDKRVRWQNASPSTVSFFSAAGYFFGKTIQEKIGVPVGLIMAAVGDTTVAPWTPKPEADSLPKHYYDSNYINRWDSVYYNSMIHPLHKLKVKGVLWYQGENQPTDYDIMLSALIGGWRRTFADKLKFIVVQLPRFSQGDDEAWYESREMQKKVAETTEDVFLSVNIDLGIASDDLNQAIHPKDKKPVGERAAAIAFEKIYKLEGLYRGPVYTGYTVKNKEIKIKYENTGEGLKLINGAAGFEIEGASEKYIPASVRIEGNSVVISADIIPKGFRYAYGAFPNVTLYNSGNYPAEQLKIHF